MALVHTNNTVGTTPTQIIQVPNGIGYAAVQIQNLDTASIWIGDTTITTSGATRGHLIAASGTFQLWLHGGDKVYAISAAGSAAGSCVITYSGE